MPAAQADTVDAPAGRRTSTPTWRRCSPSSPGCPRAIRGRAQLRAELITGYLPVAHNIAHRFVHRGDHPDDLEQVATLGLIGAVDRFEPERGVDFLLFAVPTITGEIRRHFRDRRGPSASRAGSSSSRRGLYEAVEQLTQTPPPRTAPQRARRAPRHPPARR